MKGALTDRYVEAKRLALEAAELPAGNERASEKDERDHAAQEDHLADRIVQDGDLEQRVVDGKACHRHAQSKYPASVGPGV